MKFTFGHSMFRFDNSIINAVQYSPKFLSCFR